MSDNVVIYDSRTVPLAGQLKYPAIATINVGESFLVKCPKPSDKIKLSHYIYRQGAVHDKKFSWKTQDGGIVRVTRVS